MTVTQTSPRTSRWKAKLTAGCATLGLLGASVAGGAGHELATAPEAQAATNVTVDPGTVSASGQTDISVSGTGFQSVEGGFGGIYVFYGWVDESNGDAWKPSNGGKTGEDYVYVPDTEAKDNNGFQRFVTFPGSGTASAANGGTLEADGTWSLNMKTPGGKFDGVDRDGNTKTIDCTEVTCGIITIGAHGVANPSNESFTPVNIEGQANEDSVNVDVDEDASAATQETGPDSSDSASSDSESSGSSDFSDPEVIEGEVLENPQQAEVDALAEAQENDGGSASDSGNSDSSDSGSDSGEVDADGGVDGATEPEEDDSDSGDGDSAAAAPADAENQELEVDLQQETVQNGKVLGFSARGFTPGEQVAATMGTGAAGVGPLTAGEYGEVAGAMPIPEEITPGTYQLRLTAARSGEVIQSEFTVIEDPVAASQNEATDEDDPWSWGLMAVLIVAALILIFIIVSLVMTLVRQHKAAKDEDSDEDSDDEDSDDEELLSADAGMKG